MRPDTRDQFLEAVAPMVAATLEEHGSAVYAFTPDPSDPDLIRLDEEWDGQASLDAHAASAHTAAWRERSAGRPLVSRDVRLHEATLVRTLEPHSRTPQPEATAGPHGSSRPTTDRRLRIVDNPASGADCPTVTGVRCMLMRGGTSKGAYFVADDLPDDPTARDDLLLRIMGSPDPRQIDGVGGAHPLTTKVAVVSRSNRPGIDLEYLFLQPSVEQPIVSDAQNCGNMLAAVGPFGLERGLIGPAAEGAHAVSTRIYMANTDSIVTARFPVGADGLPDYAGDTAIDGVPGTAAAVMLDFEDVAGGSCGALLPTGNVVDVIDGIEVTLIDNGMPVVVMRATDLGIDGDETPTELEANAELRRRLEAIRLQAGPLMHLGDVTDSSVPKLSLVSAPLAGGHINTRTFIPHRCHEAIGVLGAVSVATAALLPDSPAAGVVHFGEDHGTIVCEHPTGTFAASVDAEVSEHGVVEVRRAGIVRTARKLMDGIVFPRTY